jgi:hypothetical protein
VAVPHSRLRLTGLLTLVAGSVGFVADLPSVSIGLQWIFGWFDISPTFQTFAFGLICTGVILLCLSLWHQTTGAVPLPEVEMRARRCIELTLMPAIEDSLRDLRFLVLHGHSDRLASVEAAVYVLLNDQYTGLKLILERMRHDFLFPLHEFSNLELELHVVLQHIYSERGEHSGLSSLSSRRTTVDRALVQVDPSIPGLASAHAETLRRAMDDKTTLLASCQS